MKNESMNAIVWVVCNATEYESLTFPARAEARQSLADHKEGCRLNGEPVFWTHIERCRIRREER